MGICASIQSSKSQQTLLITNGPTSSSTTKTTTTKVINSIDGKLQEFRQPIKASHVLSDQPNYFLCSSENMFVNCHVPHVPEDEDLQPGQIYFLMPVSKSCKPLSLQELCVLAIKASLALEKNEEIMKRTTTTTSSFSGLRKRNGNVRKRSSNERVDFQLALKKLA